MSKKTIEQKWDAQHYDQKIGYVSQLGVGLIELLAPQPGERILDLGCGTGDLAQQIAQRGAVCAGVDYSSAMIETAKEKYPDLSFRIADAEQFRLEEGEERYDAVFSNAALHWMKRPEAVIESVGLALRPGGRFAAEFGGMGNVGAIVGALTNELERIGIDWKTRFPWYFPSVGQYTSLLEQGGFEVHYAELYDRPTPLGSGEDGLNNWLLAFAGSLMEGIEPETQQEIAENCAAALKPKLYRDGEWIADYRRLRVMAAFHQ
ncbi:SAM-dependent methyltransferase [Saccharibacillus sp. O16]|nr:SAM-dependent methyltransferase [Saccharibacillus sp. O16]